MKELVDAMPNTSVNGSLIKTNGSSVTTAKILPTPINRWSNALESVLEQPTSQLPQRLLIAGATFCLAFGVWAWVGQIDEVGHARGKLTPHGETYKIHPIELGKVTMIHVREGETVKAGQLLVTLDTQLAQDEVVRLEKVLAAYRIEFNQKSELLMNARLAAQTQKAISSAEILAQQAAIAQTKTTAATTEKLISQYHTDVVSNEERIQRIKPLVDAGALPKEQLFQAEEQLRDRQSTIIKSQGELQQKDSEVEQLQAGFVQKQAQENQSQLSAQAQIQQLNVQITELNAKMVETQKLLDMAKAKLGERFLYAPVAGVVSSLNIRNMGEVVQPGQTIAEIAASNAPLVLLADLPNQEAGFVKPNMPVQVKLDAYPYQDYGIIPGRVVSTAADSKPDERLGAVYRVEIALDRHYITDHQRPIPFKAGQTATADIVIRRRRIADILFAPIRQLQKGGMSL